MRTFNMESSKLSLVEAIKRNGTWFTISAVGLILIVGTVLINDPSKWWIALAVALGISATLFAAINGRVVLKAIGSIFVLALMVAGSTMAGSMVATVPIYGVTWPVYQIATYLTALAFSYVVYSGRSRWTYLGFMATFQFALTLFLVIFNTDPHLSALLGSGSALLSFVLAYLLNGRTRVSSAMPSAAMDPEFVEAVFEGARALSLEARIVPARRNVDSHMLVFGEKSLLLYPVALEQSFGVIGRRGSQLAYRGKPINSWLLKLSFFTSPSWKAKGATPSLVLVDVNRKNGAEGKLMGVSLPDSKREAVVGIEPAPPMRKDRASYGKRLIASSFRLVEDYTAELSPRQQKALRDIGFGEDEIEDFEKTESTSEVELDKVESENPNSTK